MIKPPKIYLKRKDIPIESLYDMRDEDGETKPAGTYDKKNGDRLDSDTRSTTLKKVSTQDYPEVNHILLNMVNIWDGTFDPNDYYVGEYNYLKYGEGDHFVRHKDHINQKSGSSGRIYSTTTIIKKSDDLVGGDFVIWDDVKMEHTVNLDVGETIFFSSFRDHEVRKVMKGEREVLVAWIYKKT